MTFAPAEILDLHAALTRARAMGFDKTADAMQMVLEDMLAADGRGAETSTVPPRPTEKKQ